MFREELWRELHYDRSIVMSMSSIKSLLEDVEINDEVINVFLRIIQVESHRVGSALPTRICLVRIEIMVCMFVYIGIVKVFTVIYFAISCSQCG
jgi:hypothetical protein